MQNCASFGLTLPRHLEEVFWLRQDIVPIEVKESGGADGARPPSAHTGLAWREECCYPVSAPGGLGPCKPTAGPEHAAKPEPSIVPSCTLHSLQCSWSKHAASGRTHFGAKAMSVSILHLRGHELLEQQAL